MNTESLHASLQTLIRTRRTIGKFLQSPAPDTEQILDLLDAAVYAPNHHLTEPWRFVLLSGETKDKYAQIRGDMTAEKIEPTKGEAARQEAWQGAYTKFANVPLYLVVAVRVDANSETAEEDFAAACAMTQNLLLLAWQQGIGTAWKTFKNDPRLRTLCGLAEDEKVVGIVHVGYPDPSEQFNARRLPARYKATILR
jgi:nitroreductase